MSLTRPIGQKSTFSEHCHVAYQIKGNHECSNMETNILLADTPPPKVNLGGWRNGIYVLWFMSFLKLPFARDINLTYLPCLTSFGKTTNPYLGILVWIIGTYSSFMCEKLVPIHLTCVELVLIPLTCKKLVPAPHAWEELAPIPH